ncbi:MAG TPA: hypothetical protein VF226_16050 [Hyphomicrobiaceae bacterium]
MSRSRLSDSDLRDSGLDRADTPAVVAEVYTRDTGATPPKAAARLTNDAGATSPRNGEEYIAA